MHSQGLDGVFFILIFLWMVSRMVSQCSNLKLPDKGAEREARSEGPDNRSFLHKGIESLCLHF